MSHKVIQVEIVKEMEKSYLDYAMSVIVDRALPDARDGLKPVQRRILFAMNQMGLSPGGKYSKSAKVVGEVLGKYHPHGDDPVYYAAVRMAQTFSLRYTLIDGQGNFGSIDGDPPAAMRYTEMRLSKISEEMLTDLKKDTVKWIDNFDASLKEPTLLPARMPNLLLNGADGIAVGVATKIPPHHLGELAQAIGFIYTHCTIELAQDNKLVNMLSKPESTEEKILSGLKQYEHQYFKIDTTATVEDLMGFVKGPDFPTRGEIHGSKSLQELYQTGRGKFVVRGKAEIHETKTGKFKIIISELPYQVNKSDLIVKIANLVKDKKIVGISDLRDETARQGIRVVVDIKKSGRPKSVLNKLFKYTSLQISYPANIVALVDGIPQTINLRHALLIFIRHREEVVRRRTLFELKEAKLRAHILEGLKIALDNLDEVIKTIRQSKDADEARGNLMGRFGLSDLQAIAILDMQLRRLAALERQKIDTEYKEVQSTIDRLVAILTKPEVLLAVLKEENDTILTKYTDPRKTRIFKSELGDISEEDIVPDENVVITITKSGYIKRVPRDTFRSQSRGGKGVVGMTTKEEDEIVHLLTASTHDYLLFFTNRGRVFKLRTWEIPDSSRQSKGQAVINLVNIEQKEEIHAVQRIKKDTKYTYIILATKKGTVKKTALNKFQNIRQNGIAAIVLQPEDELVWAKPTVGTDQVFLVTHEGKCIRFSESDLRPMGRHTKGVRGIHLKPNDRVVAMDVIPNKLNQPEDRRKKVFRHLMVTTEKGMGKRTDVYNYPLQRRGGVGVKVASLTEKTGRVACAQIVSEKIKQILLTTHKGIVIKLPLKNIPLLSRTTQGVILMRFKSTSDSLSTLACLKD